jgi:hypothetical protein
LGRPLRPAMPRWTLSSLDTFGGLPVGALPTLMLGGCTAGGVTDAAAAGAIALATKLSDNAPLISILLSIKNLLDC